MKATLKFFVFVSIVSTLILTSCRTEEVELIEAPEEQTLEANSNVANLMQRTASNDGSIDNIIDNSNCFTIQLPIVVSVNGIELTIDSHNDFEAIETIFDEFDDDIDELQIQFPITIVLSDFTELVINSVSEFNTISNNCNGENEPDDDIECLDFQYPITATLFNSNNEMIDTITINTDNELYNFIENIDENDIISIQFPITIILLDETVLTIGNFDELETTINNFADDCDEDDDYDYNDDDCDNCSTSDLVTIFADCAEWIVDKLERNDNDLEDNYEGYEFEFNNNGTITVTQGTNTFSGTWAASGTGNNISLIINVTGLSDFNDTWNLHEIEQEDDDEVKVDLRLGDDRLRFESDCSSEGSVDDSALVNALTNGDWYVTYFFDDTNETADFSDYVFNFASDNTAIATDMSGTTNGSWSTSSGDNTELGLNLNFGTGIPLDEVADDWDVLEVTNEIIRLKDISGGDGSEDFLTFERTPFDGGGDDNLEDTLTDGLWIVASYTEDADDQTADYNGYQLDFNTSGTVIANNGSNPNNGTWSVINSGNQMTLDFGTAMPFSELNDDDWNVISVSGTEVIIQDVSGGGGGTDTLTLQKL